MKTKLLCLLALAAAPAFAQFPSWAYPLTPQAPAPAPEDGTLHSVPGSSLRMTATQTTDRFAPPDWHPADHPTMPPIVASGRKADGIWACAFCHRPNGAGGPENAGIAGLPADYIAQQLKDMASGARSTALPERRPHQLKMPVAKGVTDEELRTAAKYFSSLPRPQNMLVQESDTAPKLEQRVFFWAPAPGGVRDPIGDRIVEYPEDVERFERLRDPRVRFVAIVPTGSVARGEAMVKAPGKTTGLNCAGCHGADLRGVGTIPPLAGRSPSYLMRQLWDMQAGARNGAMAQLMKPVVADMTSKDMLNIVAYLATLKP